MSEEKSKSVKNPSTNVGEMQHLSEQQQQQQQQRTQQQQQAPVSAHAQTSTSQVPPPSSTSTEQAGVQAGVQSGVGVSIQQQGAPTRVVTEQIRTYEQQAPLTMGVGVGAESMMSNQPISEPTIDLFNRFVAKDTHCLLGKTGIKISRICLGTLNFGSITSKFGERPGQLDEGQAHKILDRFVELGGNCIDTADFFPWFGPDVGKTETIIGNWLSKQDRSKIFLITKVRMPQDIENINSVGLSRGHLIDSVNKSLKRLKTNCIDMLCLNGWDPTVSFHETVRHLDDLVQTDKIRYIGVCDFKGWQLQKFIDAAKNLDMHKCVCYLGEYNLLTRGCELEVLDVCKNERIGFIAYSPLKYGFLTDDTVKNVNEPVPNSRIESVTKWRQQNKLNLAAMAEPFDAIRQNPVYFNVLNCCAQIARKYNVSVSQVAIQWILQKGVCTSVCVGVEDVKELEENMTCLIGEFVLSQDEMNTLDLASAVHLHYPYRCQLGEVAGFREILPLQSTEFEQLNVLTHALELNSLREQRLDMGETWHESINQPLPEREFMRYPAMKAQQMQRTGLASRIQKPSSLMEESKIIQ